MDLQEPYPQFQKIPRLRRDCVITEKIDGSNALIWIGEDGEFLTGSRTRWITPGDDNYGFSRWAHDHKEELLPLGPGHHYGEWWGQGIQRRYGLAEKRFSLFNVGRWCLSGVIPGGGKHELPACCGLVPILYQGPFNLQIIDLEIDLLRTDGSVAARGFMQPEGIVVYHEASRGYFKQTIKNDEKPKGQEST
jgi:hypothetical protein